ncbi:MAG: hypothetical protein EOO65_00485 [Methanosarcinales archaeon]|nr:MAG: hypothetical protein EOO65_00485 [Methanosarcinales archaeon]
MSIGGWAGGGGTGSVAYTAQLTAQAAHARADDLWSAVRHGDARRVSRILTHKPSRAAERGTLGETLLHCAYLHHEASYARVAAALIEAHPPIVSGIYERQPYYGENALHMVAVMGDVAAARMLLSHDMNLLYGRATGSFFHKTAASVAARSYYGETPLAFAISFNHADLVIELIVNQGASMLGLDSHGHHAGHMCVYHSNLKMYDLVDSLWNQGFGRPLVWREDHGSRLSDLMDGSQSTPIALTARLGDKDMFEFLWQRERELEWSWGHIFSWQLPLEHIDDIAPTDKRLIAEQRKVRHRNFEVERTLTRAGSRANSMLTSRSSFGSSSQLDAIANPLVPSDSSSSVSARGVGTMPVIAAVAVAYKSLPESEVRGDAAAEGDAAAACCTGVEHAPPMNAGSTAASRLPLSSDAVSSRRVADDVLSEVGSAPPPTSDAPSATAVAYTTTMAPTAGDTLRRGGSGIELPQLRLPTSSSQRSSMRRARGTTGSATLAPMLEHDSLDEEVEGKLGVDARAREDTPDGADGAVACTPTDLDDVAFSVSGSMPVPLPVPDTCAGTGATLIPQVTALDKTESTPYQPRVPACVSWLQRAVSHCCTSRASSEHEQKALRVLAEGDCHSIVMLDSMQSLMNVKWAKATKSVLAARLFFAASLVAVLFVSSIARSSMPQGRKLLTCEDNDDFSCTSVKAIEVLLILLTAAHALLCLRRIVKQGFVRVLWRSRGVLWLDNNVLMMGVVLLTAALCADAALGKCEAVQYLYALAAVLWWCALLWFLVAWRHTGPLVMVVYTMVVSDVFRFMLLSVPILFGFAQALLDIGSPGADMSDSTGYYDGLPPEVSGWTRIRRNLRTIFEVLVNPGLGAPVGNDSMSYFLVLYVIIGPLVLLTLLIGMFDHTLSTVLTESEQKWQLERARIIVGFDADLPVRCLRLKPYYSMKDGKPWMIVGETRLQELRSAQRESQLDAALNWVRSPAFARLTPASALGALPLPGRTGAAPPKSTA